MEGIAINGLIFSIDTQNIGDLTLLVICDTQYKRQLS